MDALESVQDNRKKGIVVASYCVVALSICVYWFFALHSRTDPTYIDSIYERLDSRILFRDRVSIILPENLYGVRKIKKIIQKGDIALEYIVDFIHESIDEEEVVHKIRKNMHMPRNTSDAHVFLVRRDKIKDLELKTQKVYGSHDFRNFFVVVENCYELEKITDFILENLSGTSRLLTNPDAKILKYDKEYRLVFSLMVPDGYCDNIRWEIQEPLNRYWSIFMKRISHLSAFKVISQIRCYNSHNTKLYPKHLSEDIIRNIHLDKWNLNHSDQSQSINFVLYPHYPNPNQTSYEKLFLIPQWGSIYSYDVNTYTKGFAIDEETINMSVISFMHAVRIMLGFEGVRDGISYSDGDFYPGISLQENMHLTMYWHNRNIRETISLLNSLRARVDHSKTSIGKIKLILDMIDTNLLFHVDIETIKRSYILSVAVRRAIEDVLLDPKIAVDKYFPKDSSYVINMSILLPLVIPVLVTVAKYTKG